MTPSSLRDFLPRATKTRPDRHFSGRDPIGYFFHQQLTELVSGTARQPVKPSFSFFASYRPGSVLPPHRDREQCEYTLSIALDFSPEPEDKSPWPLYLPAARQFDGEAFADGSRGRCLYLRPRSHTSP